MADLTPEQARIELKKLKANNFEPTMNAEPTDNAFGAPPAPSKPGLKAPLLPPELREEDPNAPEATVPVSKADLQQLQELVSRLMKGASASPQSPDEMQSAKSDTMMGDDESGDEEPAGDESLEEDQTDPNETSDKPPANDEPLDASNDDELTDEQYLAKYFKHKLPK